MTWNQRFLSQAIKFRLDLNSIARAGNFGYLLLVCIYLEFKGFRIVVNI